MSSRVAVLCRMGLLLTSAAGCSLGDSPAGVSQSTSVASADLRIDGQAFPVSRVSAMGGVGRVYISFMQAPPTFQILSVDLTNIATPGRYPLDVTYGLPGGRAFLLTASSTTSLSSLSSKHASEIEITQLSSSGVRGSVDIYMANSSDPNTTVHATGTFSTPFTFIQFTPLDPSEVNRVDISINGTSARATALSGGRYQDDASVTIETAEYSIRLSLDKVAAPKSYVAGPGQPSIASISARGQTGYWSSNAAGSSGSVTLTRVTTTRVEGTFDLVVGSSFGAPGTQPIRIAGSFSSARS